MRSTHNLVLDDATVLVAPGGHQYGFGILTGDNLGKLQVANYQREALPVTSQDDWQEAFANGEVPPIDVSCRGSRYEFTNDNRLIIPAQQTYVVDGLQRVTVAKLLAAKTGLIHLPAMFYLDRTYEWEAERFRTINLRRRKIAPSVRLRNSASYLEATEVLLNLTTQGNHPLVGRVQWTQLSQGELMTASSLLQVIGRLHASFGSGLASNEPEALAYSMNDVVTRIGKAKFRANIVTFFKVINLACGGIRRKASPTGVIELSRGYMLSLAFMLATYSTFWDSGRLVLTDDDIEALSGLKLDTTSRLLVTTKSRALEGIADRFRATLPADRRRRLTRWTDV